MKPVNITLKGTTWRKLEKFAMEHPEGFYLNYDTVTQDLLKGKVKRRVKIENKSDKEVEA